MRYFDPVDKIWYGPKETPLFHPDASAGKVLEFVMKQHYCKVGLICDPTGEEWTYEKLHKTAVNIAQNISTKGLSQDDVIGICASNSLYSTSVALAALITGIPISSIDPSFDKEGIQHIYGITKPKIVFCDGSVLNKLSEGLREIGLQTEIFVVDSNEESGTIDEFLKESDECFRSSHLKYGGDHTAIFVTSSGSTGLPKAVCISHKTLLNNCFIETNYNDTVLCFSTLFWISGLITFFKAILHGAKRVITNKPFSAEYLLHLIEKYQVTILVTPPTSLVLLGHSPKLQSTDLKSLTQYLLAGSVIPFDILKKVKEYMPNATMIAGYGCSELGSCCTSGEITAPNANGHVRENYELKIIDEQSNNLGVWETGEIVVKRPTPWLGYFGNDAATDHIWSDGQLLTGDLGYFDEKGTLYIVGRKKYIMKYQGFQYSPNEIEQVILELSDVVEVCVCGIPDFISIDLPAAAVVKKNGSSLSENEISEYVHRKMPVYKQLHGGVYFMDEIPKTVNGKSLRKVVKEKLINLHAARTFRSD